MTLAALAGLSACADRDRPQLTQPSFSQDSPQQQGRDRALERFPEMLEFLPAVRIDPPPPELSDADLVADVARAGGRVFIGLKPASTSRTRETGEIPAIDRSTALAARAAIQALGVAITRTYRHSSAVVARIAPELAPVLRRLPVVDYVEAEFPGYVQATEPQDTSWGVKKVSAHLVWSGGYGPPTRGHGAFVTMLDTGVDSVHRFWGDGPANMYIDCYWIEGTDPNPTAADSTCYDNQPANKRGHGAHVAGIIASWDDDQGFIGIAHNLQGFASIRVCDKNNHCPPNSVVAALDWVLGSGRPRHIVNMSFGWCRHYTNVAGMVATLANQGVLLIGSAGNAYSNANTCPEQDPQLGPTEVMYPARYSQVMAVSGTLATDSFATPPAAPGSGGGGDPCAIPGACPDVQGGCYGSRSGSEVEIAAPFRASSMWGGGQYKDLCGTSLSAALVSGVAALVWSHNPTWTAAGIRQRLRNTAVPYSPAEQYGSGRVYALYAVYGAPPPPPTASISGPEEVQPWATCSFTANTDLPDPPYTYEWFVDDVPVGYYGSYYYHTAEGPGTSFSLRVTVQNSQGQQAHGLKDVTVSESAAECLDQ